MYIYIYIYTHIAGVASRSLNQTGWPYIYGEVLLFEILYIYIYIYRVVRQSQLMWPWCLRIKHTLLFSLTVESSHGDQ